MDKISYKTYIRELIHKKPSIILYFILVIGFGLRLYLIGTREIFYDDGFSYWLSLNSLPEIIRGTVADTMPPLYYFLLHLWSKISRELWFLRLLNGTLSLITLIFVYKFASQWFGKVHGLIAALLVAILPFQIYHAQELRMYVLLLLGQIGYFYFFYKFIVTETDEVKNAFFTLFFGLMAMYSHNLAIFGLISVNLYFFLNPSSSVLKKLMILQGILAVGFLPWLIFLPQQITKIQTAFWTPRPGIVEAIQSVISLFSFLPMPILWTIIVSVLIFQSAAIILYWVFRNRNQKRLILLAMIFFPGLLLFLVSYMMRPVFVPRALITSSALFLVLASDFIVQTWKLQVGKFVMVSLVVSAFIGLFYFYQYESFPRSSFHDAVNYLETVVLDDEMVLHDNKLSFYPMMFYSPDLEQVYLADAPGTPNDTLAVDSQEVMGFLAEPEINSIHLSDKVYFVVFLKAIEEYQQEGLDHPGIDVLLKTHQLVEITRFGDLHLYYFEQKK